MNAPNAIAATEDFEFAALWEAGNYRRAIVREFQSKLSGHVLEVGCGIGQMSREFLQTGRIETLTCVEPDEGFAGEHARAIPEAILVVGTSEDLAHDLAPDCIISINVLEHIEQDAEEMARYRRLLAKRCGAICVLVPARPEIYAPLDKDFGHFRRYRKDELRQKLEGAGFQVENLHYFNSVGYFAWWFSFKLLGKRSFGIRQVRFFDRFIFPLVNAVERGWFRPMIGQSLIAIAIARPLAAAPARA